MPSASSMFLRGTCSGHRKLGSWAPSLDSGGRFRLGRCGFRRRGGWQGRSQPWGLRRDRQEEDHRQVTTHIPVPAGRRCNKTPYGLISGLGPQSRPVGGSSPGAGGRPWHGRESECCSRMVGGGEQRCHRVGAGSPFIRRFMGSPSSINILSAFSVPASVIWR